MSGTTSDGATGQGAVPGAPDDSFTATEIDRAFAEIASDPVYHAEADALMKGFAVADWEAFLASESEPASPR